MGAGSNGYGKVFKVSSSHWLEIRVAGLGPLCILWMLYNKVEVLDLQIECHMPKDRVLDLQGSMML